MPNTNLRYRCLLYSTTLMLVGMHSACAAPAEDAALTPETEITQYPGYELVFNDEFDVDGPPNPEDWSFDESGFVRNYEDQWYQRDNAWVEDGRLIIEARRLDEPRPNPLYEEGSEDWRKQRKYVEYTSSLIDTSGKHAWTYGRWEIRGKIDIGAGLWPAIWTIGTAPRPWPANGEIDIMEYYRDKIMANAAWAKPGEYQARWDSSGTPMKEIAEDPEAWAREFHVWRMDWDEQSIRLYLDGRLLNEIELSKTINETPDGANPFHDPHFLLLNFAVGGNNGGDPSATEFPKRFEVDYVRIYQKVETE